MKPRIKYWPEAGCWTLEAAKGQKLTNEQVSAFNKWADKISQES